MEHRLCFYLFFFKLILSSLYVSLDSCWNDFRMVPYFFQVLSSPSGDIFEVANNKMTSTISNHSHLFKIYEEDQVGAEITVEKMLTELRGIIAYIYIYIYISRKGKTEERHMFIGLFICQVFCLFPLYR